MIGSTKEHTDIDNIISWISIAGMFAGIVGMFISLMQPNTDIRIGTIAALITACSALLYRWIARKRQHRISELEEIVKLMQLTRLDLSKKELTKLPSELFQLSKLTNLTDIDLSGNKLTNLPPEFFQLTSLIRLNLSGNQLKEVPPAIGELTNLTAIDLRGNQITQLPYEICRLPGLTKVEISGNPLVSPSLEIACKGIEAIRDYFAKLEGEAQPLNEVKILLVGEGATGKTSLVRKLLGNTFNSHEDTTHGISIRCWEVEQNNKSIRVNIWDFGGQEIMHATHQFFFSRRSLYVLVLDGRRDERTEYWLRHIESFGGSSPVLVVLNKQDMNPSFDINRPFLLQKYPSIRVFFRTSCKTGEGLSEFKEGLLNELAKMEITGICWPRSWLVVKQRIEQMDKPYISSEEYQSICQAARVSEQTVQETLVDFLHDLGVAVHFKDFILNATYVLDPRWVTTAVYRIINAKEIADSKGILHIESLGWILNQTEGDTFFYPAHTHSYILELMKKFELCYHIGEKAVLIPQILPVSEPEFSFDYSNALGFVLHYHDFLPPSVLPRFLVKRHGHIKEHLCWRTGVVLNDKESETEAVVKVDAEARRIHLWVNGPRRKEYLSFLWFSLRDINESFGKLVVSERIPMPDDPHVTADYQTLLDCVQDGIELCRPDGAKKSYNVKELLGLVEPDREDQIVELLRMIKSQYEGKQSSEEAINSLFELKPSIFGVGLNLNEAFKRILTIKKRK
jgi:small GTP-binding protein